MRCEKDARNFACLTRALLPRNRSGSHVGMIISFVIFITFIVFLYTVVNPVINIGENKKATLDYIDSKIMENVSANFTTASVDFTNNPGQNCILLVSLLFDLQISNPAIVVKNETGNIQEAYEQTYSLAINRKVLGNRFFKVYQSSEFDRLLPLPASLTPPPESRCKTMSESSYDVGSVTVGTYAFERELYKLIDYYKADYEKLKQDFKVSPGSEFGFDFVQGNGTRISIGQAPESVSVYAEEIPLQYIDNQANILSGFINIKVW